MVAQRVTDRIIELLSERRLIHITVDASLEGPSASGDYELIVRAEVDACPLSGVDVDEVIYQAIEDGFAEARRALEERGCRVRLWRVR